MENRIELTPEILLSLGFSAELLDDNYPAEGMYYHLRLSSDRYCDLALLSGDKNGYMEVTLFPYTETFRYRYLDEVLAIYKAITGADFNNKIANGKDK